MENENIMNESMDVEVVDFNNEFDNYETTGETNSNVDTGVAIAAIAAGVVAVGGIIAAIIYKNKDKIEERKLRRMEKKLNKKGYGIVKFDDDTCEECDH